ncbi:MAG TPA: hypothetical protein VFG86_15205 [Chloroflexota bacterium]|nr:hypothetical protein [Chloroflexota bacterium]
MHVQVSRLIPVVSAFAAVLVLGTGSAAAQTAAPSSGWAPGPDAATASNTFTGFIDNPSTGATLPTSGAISVNGWFVDTTAQGWAGADDVQLFLGQMGSGGTMLGKGVVGGNRPDVASALGNPYWAASGFSITVPSASLPAGSNTLGVYLHTPGKGWWYEPLTINASATAAPQPSVSGAVATGVPQITVTDPTEDQDISTKNGDHTIEGTVSSPGASASDIDRIEVWINGERDSGTLLGTTTPNSDGSWSLAFTPTHFASTHSNIYVYAHSKSTGKETETVRGFNITDK